MAKRTRVNPSGSFLDKLEGMQESDLNQKILEYMGQFKGHLKKFLIIAIGYSFMSWIYLSLYDSFGFQKTLIILLVGVFWYGIRRN